MVTQLFPKRLLPTLKTSWMSIDPRALALFRISFGLVCIVDVLIRVQHIVLFYSDKGVLPGHYAIYRMGSGHAFSILHSISSPTGVTLYFLGTIVALVCYTVGYKTKLFQFVCTLLVISLHNRNLVLETGGEIVCNLWWLWTLFLPLGKRYSVDSLLRSLRAPDTVASLRQTTPTKHSRLVCHGAVLVILMQLSAIYALNAINKGGSTWMDGSAVAYVMQQERMLWLFGFVVRDSFPDWTIRFLTYGTLVIEAVAPILILLPILQTYCRTAAIVMLSALHIGIFVTIDVGLFSPFMMVGLWFLFTPKMLDSLGQFCKRFSTSTTTLWYDNDCGICFHSARLLRRLDVYGQLSLQATRGENTILPNAMSQDTFETIREKSIIVSYVSSGKQVTSTGIKAWAATIRTLPFGRLYAWMLLVPGIRHLLEIVYQKVSTSRHKISSWAGLPACGVDYKSTPLSSDVSIPSTGSTPQAIGGMGRLPGKILSHAVLALFAYAMTTQLFIESSAIADRISIDQPAWANTVRDRGRWFQGWRMFAPNPPTDDGKWVIDVTLKDGRRIDACTGTTPSFAPIKYRSGCMDMMTDVFSARLAQKRFSDLRSRFRDWLLRPTHRFTLRPEDKITRLDMWWVTYTSPGLGDRPVVEMSRQKLLSWPKQ